MSKVAFITGASRGIGRATAIAFAKAGYRVAITARELDNELSAQSTKGSLTQTAKMMQQAGGEVLALPMDLLDFNSVASVLKQVLQQFGKIDVVINNAIYQGAGLNAALLDVTQQTLENVARGYIGAPVQIAQAVLPSMLAQHSGCIINITSGAGEKDPPIPASKGGWGYAYGAGKAAVSRLSGIICREHGHQGIRAFTVNPGVVNTETLRATIGDIGIQGLQQAVAEPETIAEVLLWIAENTAADELQYRTIAAQKLARELNLLA
ncbi:SDR family NAD(P)-dependent oxidoreductase [Pseudoalteromonas sp.]|uniref:SDR family NAD(P)-dependent oxidoreductase n=1 Tax=Pseudoalteromonas sp. TaxID=53249 RepID=UPI003563C7D4